MDLKKETLSLENFLLLLSLSSTIGLTGPIQQKIQLVVLNNYDQQKRNLVLFSTVVSNDFGTKSYQYEIRQLIKNIVDSVQTSTTKAQHH